MKKLIVLLTFFFNTRNLLAGMSFRHFLSFMFFDQMFVLIWLVDKTRVFSLDQCGNAEVNCSSILKIQYWNVQPYEMIFREIIEASLKDCCGACVNFTYSDKPANDSEQLRELIGALYNFC